LQIRRTGTLKVGGIRRRRGIFASKSTAIVAKNSISSEGPCRPFRDSVRLWPSVDEFRADLIFRPSIMVGEGPVCLCCRRCIGVRRRPERENLRACSTSRKAPPELGRGLSLFERDDPVGRADRPVIDRAADHQNEEKQPRKGCAVFARKHGPTSGLPLAVGRASFG
jgi:hypothetical protein